jgi:hypothetical protein
MQHRLSSPHEDPELVVAELVLVWVDREVLADET